MQGMILSIFGNYNNKSFSEAVIGSVLQPNSFVEVFRDNFVDSLNNFGAVNSMKNLANAAVACSRSNSDMIQLQLIVEVTDMIQLLLAYSRKNSDMIQLQLTEEVTII